MDGLPENGYNLTRVAPVTDTCQHEKDTGPAGRQSCHAGGDRTDPLAARYSQPELDELCRVLREEQLGGCDAPQIAALEEQEWARRMEIPYCCAVGAGSDALPHGAVGRRRRSRR